MIEGKRRLIDGFVNSIYLYGDRFNITFNFKDGTQTVFFSEIEATKNSDIKSLGALSLNSLNFFAVKKTFGLFCYIDEFEQFTL